MNAKFKTVTLPSSVLPTAPKEGMIYNDSTSKQIKAYLNSQWVTLSGGSAGTNGKEVELQKNSTHIQWRYVGDTNWTNLIALSDITGVSGALVADSVTDGVTNVAPSQNAVFDAIATEASSRSSADSSITSSLNAHTADTSNPHNVTKAQVGLSNVQNLDQTNPANITQSASYRFVTDTEKSTWDSKQTALGFTPENSANKGAANGYAPLDSSAKIAATYLPSYVDDVLEYSTSASFPSTGETGKIYIALNANKIYRWSGSVYVEVSPSPGSTDSVTEGSSNLYFTNARASAAAPVQSVAGRTGSVTLSKSDVGLGNVDNTSDLSKPISTATQAALDAKFSNTTIFGSGIDGSLSISSGTTTLARDMYYNDLTISGTATIQTSGYKIFVKGTLDLTNAPAGAIKNSGGNGGNGTNAVGSTVGNGGAASTGTTANIVGSGAAGLAGVAGKNGTTAGNNGNAGTNPSTYSNGGGGGAGGSGAQGSVGGGAGGTGGTTPAPTTFLVSRYSEDLMRSTTIIGGGSSGGSGGSGGGGQSSTSSSGGSGGAGAGGGVIYLCANTISRGASTGAGVIQAKGGNGGNGGSSSGVSSSAGGSGGGGGGGGGWIYIIVGKLTGTAATDAIDASGGSGGNGGAGGSGTSTGAPGGAGAAGGAGGRITIVNFESSSVTETAGSAGNNGSAGNAASGTAGGSGGAGGAGNTLKSNL